MYVKACRAHCRLRPRKDGFYTMNDSWFGQYVFEVAARKSALPAGLRSLLAHYTGRFGFPAVAHELIAGVQSGILP